MLEGEDAAGSASAGGIVRGHKCVLAARSEVFANMFTLACREADQDVRNDEHETE